MYAGQLKEVKTTAYRLETGVPLPKQKSRNEKYPLSVMNVGQSFFVPSTGAPKYTSFYARAKVLGITVTVRAVDGGFRVWRTA